MADVTRRRFIGQIAGGISLGGAVRSWPFRVFSFPKEIKISRTLTRFDGAYYGDQLLSWQVQDVSGAQDRWKEYTQSFYVPNVEENLLTFELIKESQKDYKLRLESKFRELLNGHTD